LEAVFKRASALARSGQVYMQNAYATWSLEAAFKRASALTRSGQVYMQNANATRSLEAAFKRASALTRSGRVYKLGRYAELVFEGAHGDVDLYEGIGKGPRQLRKEHLTREPSHTEGAESQAIISQKAATA
jgi:hypothetical protein